MMEVCNGQYDITSPSDQRGLKPPDLGTVVAETQFSSLKEPSLTMDIEDEIAVPRELPIIVDTKFFDDEDVILEQ